MKDDYTAALQKSKSLALRFAGFILASPARQNCSMIAY